MPPQPPGIVDAWHGVTFPYDAMKFFLTFEGELPSSGNKPKPEHVWKLRNYFHPQLTELWQTSDECRHAKHASIPPAKIQGYTLTYYRNPEDGAVTEQEISDGWRLAYEPIKAGNHTFNPLVRASMKLGCTLNITFLRKGERGALILPGGDIDNRIKTLFDGLKIPDPADMESGEPCASPLNCLVENDSLITGLSVHTAPLLTSVSAAKSEVKLIIEVSVAVLSAVPENIMFLSH